MKIRNLQSYIARRCNKSTDEITSALPLLGTDEEPFLFTVLGEDPDIRNMVRDYAGVAKNAEQQVFYEFVQNAVDADADDVFFFIGNVNGTDYLLVLNNGRSFYTQDPRLSKKNREKGQLLEFLQKNKSNKNDKEDLGRFGHGSKLMYTLLVDRNEQRDTASMMASSIIDGKKAPYLLSWSDGAQLDNFRMDRREWDRSCGYNNLEMLIAKILCGYYPVEPGVSDELFSDEETSTLVRVFNELVDPERNHIRLEKQGTAIILPLGKGKADLICLERNMGKVKSCLAPFTEILKGYEKYEGKPLKNIHFFGKDLNPIETDRIVVKVPIDSVDRPGEKESVLFQFVFNQTFESEKSVNLFQVTPISDTCFNLGFIIDSRDFPVDNARQGIGDEEVAIYYLRHAMKLFVDKLNLLKNSDADKYGRIYNSLIKARPSHRIVKDPFNDVIVPYLAKNVRSINGTYNPIESSRLIDSPLPIPAAEIGVEELYLVSKADNDILVELFSSVGLVMKEITLAELLSKADTEKLKTWILGLEEKDYSLFHSAVTSAVGSSSSLKAIPVFRTNKGRVYSYNDVASASVHVFTKDHAPEAFDLWEDAEYVLEPMGTSAPPASVIWRKLQAMQDLFFSSFCGQEFACRMLSSIYGSLGNKQEVRENFKIFTNLLDERVSFNEIVLEKPDGSILYNRFTIKGGVPAAAQKDWFVSASERWAWLNRNIKAVKGLDDWDINVDSYLQDITSMAKDIPGAKIQLFLQSNGIPQETLYHCLSESTSDLSMEEYNRITALCSEHNFVPYRFRMQLSRRPFGLPKLDVKEAIGLSCKVTFQDLTLLYKIKGDTLLNDFKIQTDGRYYSLIRLSAGEKNYFYKCGHLDSAVETQLLTAKLYRVPNELTSLFVGCSCITTDPKMVVSAIRSCDNCLELIPLVERCCTSDVVKEFYAKIDKVAFNSEEDVPDDDCRWNVIEWTARKQPEYKDELWGKITMDRNALPATLAPNEVVVMKGPDKKTVSKKYKAYLLVPSLASGDELFRTLQSVLPDVDFFEHEYCFNRHKTLLSSQVVDKLNLSSLDLYQTEFFLDTVLNEGFSAPMASYGADVSLCELLNMVYSRGFVGFYEHLRVPGLDISQQSFADSRILQEKERIPQEIHSWIERMGADTKGVLSLFGSKGLNCNHSLLKFRQSMLLGENAILPKELRKEDATLLDFTYKWLESKMNSREIVPMGDVFVDNMQKLQEVLWRGADVRLLRLTGVGEKNEMTYSLVSASAPSLKFLCMKGSGAHIRNMLSNSSSKLKELIAKNTVCLPLTNEELLNRHSLGNVVRWQVRNESKRTEDWKEWGNEVYLRWRETQESNGIRIYHCNLLIQKSLSIIDEQGAVLCEDYLGAYDKYGYADEKKSVAVMVNSDLEMMKALEEASRSTDMSFFRSPYIALQGMMIVDLQEKVTNLNLGTGEDEDGEGVRISSKRADLIKDIPDEMLRLLKDGKLSLGSEGNGPGKGYEQEENEENKENRISGYIGELLYNGYLERKEIHHDWAAERMVKEYDFDVNSGWAYVDVKTNVNTLTDGHAPLYVHKSQHNFLRSHKETPYYFCRLSLMDLGLRREYMPIRKHYGDIDPHECVELESACRRLVEEFWNDPCNMEVFEATRHMYRVRVEDQETVSTMGEPILLPLQKI